MALPQTQIFDPFRGKPIRRLQREWFQRWYRFAYRNLLIVGQPKSGSTWLFNMVCELPGYLPWTPNYIKFQSHDLRDEWWRRTPAGYTVTKTHTRPTDENLRIIHATGRPYVVLLRDLRDIAVSWSFYVGNESNHPRHEHIRPLPLSSRIDYFIEEMLPEFVFWSTTWQRRHHPELGHIVRYEDLLADTVGGLGDVLRHFEIAADPIMVERIANRYCFERQTGRRPGEEDASQFNRKGIAGDWRNHFSDAHRANFKQKAADALVELGYEQDDDW